MASESRTVFPCNTCSLSFTTSARQRAHMQQSWHVCNLRRKVSGPPAMTEQDFEVQGSKSKEVTYRARHNDDALIRKPRTVLHNANFEKDTNTKVLVEDMREDYSEKSSTSRCLFCPFNPTTHTTNLEHMSTHHNLLIPSPSSLYSLDSLISYLAVLVFEYHECLYCGQEKDTIEAVQTHMRDKGHCKINMSDLQDFWDLDADRRQNEDGEDATTTQLSKTEKRLPSGLPKRSHHSRHNDEKPLGRTKPRPSHSRHSASQQRRTKRTATITSPDQGDREIPENPPSRHLALPNCSTNDRHLTTTPRTAQGLAGLSDQQIRALQMVDKKMKRREESAKARVLYAAQQQPIKTVYYKAENPVYQAG